MLGRVSLDMFAVMCPRGTYLEIKRGARSCGTVPLPVELRAQLQRSMLCPRFVNLRPYP